MADLGTLGGRSVLLIVGGGIAAYKSLELIRLIQKAGGRVTPVLTAAAAEFVTPLSAAALAGTKAYGALFDLTDEAEMGHIQLSRSADLVVVAPGDGGSDGQGRQRPRRRPRQHAAARHRQARAVRARR